jgi:hypothetical protein
MVGFSSLLFAHQDKYFLAVIKPKSESPANRDEARRIAVNVAKLPELLLDHTALGGTIKHLTFGITLSSS